MRIFKSPRGQAMPGPTRPMTGADFAPRPDTAVTWLGSAGQANYSASKAGVIGLTKATARELAARNVTCNAVAPGFIATDMTKALVEQNSDAITASIPLGRVGAPEDVAKAVSFLVSPDSTYITGEVLRVDGGMAM